MPDSSLWLLLVIIVLAIGFGVVNGFNDAANAIAASIGSRALSPRKAIILAAVFNMAGAATGLAVSVLTAGGYPQCQEKNRQQQGQGPDHPVRQFDCRDRRAGSCHLFRRAQRNHLFEDSL